MRLIKLVSSLLKTSSSGQETKSLIAEIHQRKLTYLPYGRMDSIANALIDVESRKLPGVIIETGCALGGSSILMASLKSVKRPLRVYDVFEMIPPPGERDTQDVHDRYQVIASGKSHGIGGDQYYGYRKDLFQEVKNNFKDFGIDLKKNRVELIKGLLQETLEVNEPVAMAHIDVDWYDPVLTSLQRIFPQLTSGGFIIIDDYFDWGGCRKATDFFLQSVAGQYQLEEKGGSLKIQKTN
jgi:asparagine synthase (glutamine-hydrolysing)